VVRRHADADAFLARAEAWLLTREAEHNLLLGLAYRLRESTAGFEPPIFLATVERDGAVAGCAFRTPPFKLGLTRMPQDAVPAVVAAVAEAYDALPAALGPEPETETFATLWGARRGVAVRRGMRNRIYQLEQVVAPARMPPGRLRRAEAADVPLVAGWFAEFTAEAHAQPAASREGVERRVADGRIFLWDDDGPGCMAGVAAETPRGARIGPVYTPPAARGRGYASACTAALSERMLAAGKRFCFLYTDLDNPTSNTIYQRIGYRAVCDVGDWLFGDDDAA
jgi:GNAT superfamily N-acetyltransferase